MKSLASEPGLSVISRGPIIIVQYLNAILMQAFTDIDLMSILSFSVEHSFSMLFIKLLIIKSLLNSDHIIIIPITHSVTFLWLIVVFWQQFYCSFRHKARASDISRGRAPAKFRFFHEIPRNSKKKTQNTAKSARNISKYMSAKHISYLYWLLDLCYSPQTSKFILKLRHCNE